MSGTTVSAPGWEAAWLNGWLASIGLAVRSGCRLHFEGRFNWVPVFSSPSGDLAIERLAAGFPSPEELERIAIARVHPDLEGELVRNPSLEVYAERARFARLHGDRSLGATMSDQIPPTTTELAHSAFDAAVPKGITIGERLVACRAFIEDPSTSLVASMQGLLPRVKNNGLGFDARRIAVSTAPDSEKYVDPVVEVLAFSALELFPVRGDGRFEPRAKGFEGGKSARGGFVWPVWSQPLDAPAIDALLDRFWTLRSDCGADREAWRRASKRLGIVGAYSAIPYRAVTASDTTRGFASEVLWTI